MDADRIRAAFILTQLDRARTYSATAAIRTANEFRRYVEWVRDFLPEPDRTTINDKLDQLERAFPTNQNIPR